MNDIYLHPGKRAHLCTGNIQKKSTVFTALHTVDVQHQV